MTLFEIIIIGITYSFMYGFALEACLMQIMLVEFDNTTYKMLFKNRSFAKLHGTTKGNWEL